MVRRLFLGCHRKHLIYISVIVFILLIGKPIAMVEAHIETGVGLPVDQRHR